MTEEAYSRSRWPESGIISLSAILWVCAHFLSQLQTDAGWQDALRIQNQSAWTHRIGAPLELQEGLHQTDSSRTVPSFRLCPMHHRIKPL